MKAILVIDMPKDCFKCPLRYNDGYSSEDKSTWFIRRCHLSHDQVHENEILENCLLKPLKLGDELRKFRNTIKDKNTLIGFNMAVAICNKYLGEEENG